MLVSDSHETVYIMISVELASMAKKICIAIFSDTINVTGVRIYMRILLTELYLFIPFSMTVTIFQGHSYV